MNASYSWLNAFVKVGMTPADLRDFITARCTPVDEMVSLRSDLREIVIGHVVEASRHPNSDHLWVTKVDAGTGELLDVVCGAPNVTAGKRYPFAPAGATLPGGLKLEKRKIRGASSNGMLCSSRELQLGDDHEGILELNTDAAPGTPFLTAIGVGDTRFVVDVQPNRPDLLSHLGIAREISAATQEEMHWPALPGVQQTVELTSGTPAAAHRAGPVELQLDDPVGAPRYMGVVITGVRIGSSPAWLKERLESVGVRSVNNVVDATNYMLHELGQPMHAFDAAKLRGSAIIVRRAFAGERLRTLDGVERILDSQMTVIADAERAQGVAGVMGGSESEVTDATTDIFLEVATFDPASVRRTRRALGLSTDASYRFERGTDIELPPAALARAVALIRAIAGGEVDGMPVDLYPTARARTRAVLRVSRVAQLLGVSIGAEEVVRLLRPVGFACTHRDESSLDVEIPSWRVDVRAEVDLIEEVARLRGFDSFPDELRPFRPGSVPTSTLDSVLKRVRDALVMKGLLEARPMPFVSGAEHGFVRVANPIAENEAYLRRDLLDTLARRAEHNLAQMQRNIRLFEIGSVFEPAAAALPREEVRVAALIMGDRRPSHWTEPPSPSLDEWDAKALGEEVARAIAPGSRSECRPGDGDVLWHIEIDGSKRGEIRKVWLDAPSWASQAFGAEVTVRLLSAEPVAAAGSAKYDSATIEQSAALEQVRYQVLPTTPASSFDVALLVPHDMPAVRVEEAIRRSAGSLLEKLTLLSEYRGEPIPEGVRSMAWHLLFRHPERTLESREIVGRRERLLQTLEGELGVRQRTA
ncbi:MAG: phenylalanine--tRNA ligase subunit beta [Gemmatimonadaceae bacterium]|nr:phenylalanine--tRNA ligase subunit beta [Gemmatimonadaceae bacterium]